MRSRGEGRDGRKDERGFGWIEGSERGGMVEKKKKGRARSEKVRRGGWVGAERGKGRTGRKKRVGGRKEEGRANKGEKSLRFGPGGVRKRKCELVLSVPFRC